MFNSIPFIVEFSGTPEAGKTTAIGTVANMLRSNGYKVVTLQESAESLPLEIPKGSFDANLWMHLRTQSELLKAVYTQSDIILADRGLIDSFFYGWKFEKEGKCSEEEYEKFKKMFWNELVSDLFIALIVSPSVSIKRRGGEGRLVNQQYIENYNKMFLEYFNSVKAKKELIRTDDMDVYEMNKSIYSTILKYLN